MENKTLPARPASENVLKIEITREDLRLKDPRFLDLWNLRVTDVICSGESPESGQAGRNFASLYGLLEQLERAVLVRDIMTSKNLVQERLAQNLVFLILNLEKDHQFWLQRDQEDLLRGIQCALLIEAGFPSGRTKLEETQITSIFRGLLELSGGREDAHQHDFSEDYTTSGITDLYASVFEITRTNQFGDFNPEAMCSTLSKSPMFSRMTITEQDLNKWTADMMHRLCLSFPERYLGLPSSILRGFSVGQIDDVNRYIAGTNLWFPVLQKPGNSLLLLLTWSSSISGRPPQVFMDWARSEDGQNLHNQLAKDFQISQGVEQLALTIAAWMSYRRHLPDFLDHLVQPIKVSYLADLHALLEGQSLGNSGVVAQQMMFSLVRVLRSFGNQFDSLITFLQSVLRRPPLLLHVYDGFSDRYLRSRINNQPHQNATLESLHIRLSELEEGNDQDYVVVNHLSVLNDQYQRLSEKIRSLVNTESSTEQSHGRSHLQTTVSTLLKGSGEGTKLSYIATPSTPNIYPKDYRLVRLSKDTYEDVSNILDAQVRTIHEVYNIEDLGDRSWELLILNAYYDTLKVILNKILPGWYLNLVYDPKVPTPNELRHSNYTAAKIRRQDLFHERARRTIKRNQYPAADYYDYRITKITRQTYERAMSQNAAENF